VGEPLKRSVYMANNFRQRAINLDDKREVSLFIVAGVGALALLVIVGGLIYWFATSDSEQIVSGPVSLSSQWTEFVPQKPLRPLKQSQEIVLDVDPSEGLVEDNLHLERIQLSNGSLLLPQIQLVDSQGKVFDAEVSRYPVPSLYKNGISGYVSNLPRDREFTKVRVRSDSPVRLSRIVWHCHNGK
jgi:hypothetical protein